MIELHLTLGATNDLKDVLDDAINTHVVKDTGIHTAFKQLNPNIRIVFDMLLYLIRKPVEKHFC